MDVAEPCLVTSPASLAAAHGPGMIVTHGAGPYSFLADGTVFTKYHTHATFLSASGKRVVFYQHNHLFWLKQGVPRPPPGEEESVGTTYQSPLIDIIRIIAGKTEATFKGKQAQAVADDRAWSLLVRRKDGKEEHIDFEASSVEERDRWVQALTRLVRTAKANELEKQAKLHVVEVSYLVDVQGDVNIRITPAEPSPPPAAPANSNPLAGQSSIGHPSAAAAPSSGIVISEETSRVTSSSSSSTGIVRHMARSTTSLPPSRTLEESEAKVATLTRENQQLRARIAELEERLKATQLDGVAAS